jgi:hypothetical protein
MMQALLSREKIPRRLRREPWPLGFGCHFGLGLFVPVLDE